MQSYRPRRKDSNSKIITMALIISRIIIGGGIWYVFFKDTGPVTPTDLIKDDTGTGINNTGWDSITHYYGEKILAAWDMKATEKFTTFTHYFITDKGEQFGLKSKDIDLYTFSGHVQLKGEISDFQKDLPIISVSEIINDDSKQQKETTEDDKDVHGNPDYFLFKNEGIGFDLSISEGYTVEKKGDDIVLVDLQSDAPTDVLTISPFVCTPGDNLEDCNVLKQRLENNKADSFVSSQGIKFYHLSETKTWIAFNEAINYGYYITPKDANKFVSFANLMSFIDTSKIKAAVEKELSNVCKNIDYTLETADDFSYDWQGGLGLIKVVAKGTAEDGTKMTCKIGVKLWNTLEIEKISFNTEAWTRKKLDKVEKKELEEINKEEEKKGKEQKSEDAITPPESKNNDTYTDEDFGTGSWWFTYNSVRGYKVHFSSKNISYAGEILETPTDLGITGLKCPYKINVVTWKNADNIDTNPAVEIYECKGSVEETELANKKLQQVWKIDDVLFLTKRYNNPWGDMKIVVRE